MGSSSYMSDSRSIRASSAGFSRKSVNDIFEQNKVKRVHESMDTKKIVLRECRDSSAHPHATPIQFYLDVTGSMGQVPHQMIKDGLPKLMSSLIQNGVPDAALMFGGIGDHEYDNHPLQIGQFESGDEELDMWLTRTYIEGGGGGNGGESYLLAWYFASNHVQTDAWDKRKEKGFIFTIGDEPCLDTLPLSAVKEVMANGAVGQGTYTAADLLAAAQVNNHVFHIFLEHGGRGCDSKWREMLGDHLIVISDHNDVARVISDTIIKYNGNTKQTVVGARTEMTSLDGADLDTDNVKVIL